MLASFLHVLYTAITHKTRLYLSLYYIEKRLRIIFVKINAHNRLLHVTCHRNLETIHLKDLEEGKGSSSRRLLLKYHFIAFFSEFRYSVTPK
jgi:hypothetical protein